MANTFTNPNFIRSRPHASAEKQVGDSDPSARTDVINRVQKGLLAILKRLFNTITDGVTADFTDLTTITEFANAPIVPRAVSGTPAQHGLFRENVVKAWAYVTVGGGVPSVTDHFNVTSITDNGVGEFTLTWDRDFANATYPVAGVVTGADCYIRTGAHAAGTLPYSVLIGTTAARADYSHTIIAMGDQ